MKNGITMTVLAIAIIIMFTIVSTAVVIGTKSISTANYEEFVSKIKRVSDDINEYVIQNEAIPTTGEIVAKTGLPNSLLSEISKNSDDNNNLYVVDMKKLNTISTNIGYGTVANMDVFLIAENSNNVYYYKGIKYKGAVYHGLQD